MRLMDASIRGGGGSDGGVRLAGLNERGSKRPGGGRWTPRICLLKTDSVKRILVRRKTLRELPNALRVLPVYPVFDDKKLTGSDKKSLKQKIA